MGMKFSTFPWGFCHSRRHAAPTTPSQRPFLIWICVLCFCYCGRNLDCAGWEEAACRGRAPAFLYTQNVCFPSYQFFFNFSVETSQNTRKQEKEIGDHPSILLTSITPLGSLVPVLLEDIEGSAGAYRTRGLLGYPLYAGTHLNSPCFPPLPSLGSQLPTGAT